MTKIPFDEEYVITEIEKQVREKKIYPEEALTVQNWVIQGTDKEGNFKVYDGPVPKGLVEKAIDKARKSADYIAIFRRRRR